MQTTVRSRGSFRLFLAAGLIVGLVSFIPGKAGAVVTTSEKQMISLINQARAQAGRAPLTTSGYLSDLARKHSATMAAKNTIFHNTLLAKWLGGIAWNIVGENVGMGSSISILHEAFMSSPGHKANNLSKSYKKVGVGAVSKNGHLFVTVVFMG